MEDIWVIKLDPAGEMEWKHCFGGSSSDLGKQILQEPDGGYLVLGSTSSNNGDVSGNHGMSDIWLFKLDPDGTLVWQRCYGGSLNESAWDIHSSSDGYVIVGESRSSDGDVSDNAGGEDYWIVKTDEDGDVQWQRSYGGSSADVPSSIVRTVDDGYIVNGYTASNDGDVTEHRGSQDYWVIKLNDQGMLQWQRTCGATGDDWGHAITELSDGNYMAVGRSNSQDEDISNPLGSFDLWTVRITSTGQIAEEISFGGSSGDFGFNIHRLDGEMLICGSSLSANGDLSENQGVSDGWLFKSDLQGIIEWSLSMGGSQADSWSALSFTNDGGCILAGNSQSNDGDLLGNNGAADVWIVKLGSDPVGLDEISERCDIKLHPNPCADQLCISSLYCEGAPVALQIFDAQGRIVAHSRMATSMIDINISHLEPGPYNVVLQDASGRSSTSFMKE